MKITWICKPYSELTVDEFHDALQLRIDVFVVEQNCPYSDLDGKDKKSMHFIGKNEQGETVAYARLLPAGVSYKEVSIGRVVTATRYRHFKLGHALLKEALQFIDTHWGNVPVRISAQSHLQPFYTQHGFVTVSKEYLEDNIPHVQMWRKGGEG